MISTEAALPRRGGDGTYLCTAVELETLACLESFVFVLVTKGSNLDINLLY